MSMFWFGWLLKGSMEVSFLDTLVLFFEIFLLGFVAAAALAFNDWIRKRF